jgi:hypothetical protein
MNDELSREMSEAENEKKKLADGNRLQKNILINSIKSGLGSEIKKNPNKVRIIEKTKMEKFKFWLKNIFNKF